MISQQSPTKKADHIEGWREEPQPNHLGANNADLEPLDHPARIPPLINNGASDVATCVEEWAMTAVGATRFRWSAKPICRVRLEDSNRHEGR